MKLTIVVDVDHDIDPARTDPEELAATIILDEPEHGIAPEVELLSAEWDETP